ncbi:hypothetical protein ACQ4PT_016521 [Festuca glaucescens]
MVVSASAGSEGACLHPEEETPNPGTGNQVENEVINVEDEEDARADEPSKKRGKKTTSECWDHFYKTTKTVEVDGKKVVEQWAKCKYCTYEGKCNSRNGTSVFLNHIKMHSVKSGQQLLKLEKKDVDSVSVETYRLHEIDKKKFDKFAPTAAKWKMALTLCRCLKKFDDLTKLLSGNQYPTANLFYKGFCEIKALISGWCRSSDATIKKMAVSMQTKFDKYWHKSNLALAVAFFLDPRYKRNGIEHYMRKVHGDLLYRGKVEELLVVVKMMYLAYASKYSESTTRPNSTATAQEHATDFMEEDDDDYFQSQQGTHVSNEGDTDTDLEKYMAEKLKLSKDAFDKFDILSWWKTHQDVYPVLSMLARDVLDIQVSIVASESAFSAGGRVIDPFRSRLDPQVVEALICTKDWVAATRKGDTKRGAGLGSIVNDLEVVETLVANMSLEEQLDEKQVIEDESRDEGSWVATSRERRTGTRTVGRSRVQGVGERRARRRRSVDLVEATRHPGRRRAAHWEEWSGAGAHLTRSRRSGPPGGGEPRGALEQPCEGRVIVVS